MTFGIIIIFTNIIGFVLGQVLGLAFHHIIEEVAIALMLSAYFAAAIIDIIILAVATTFSTVITNRFVGRVVG